MSVALADHTGPWTADDVEALPDAGDHARFEVYEGGVLVVSPAPGVGHQRASYRLHCALAQAALAAAADAEVLDAENVALPGGKLLVPDVVGRDLRFVRLPLRVHDTTAAHLAR
jgi:hypothetical protein